MKLFILMTQLMTRIPIPVQVEVQNEDLGRGNRYFPLIGAMIGLLVAAAYMGLGWLFGAGLLTAVLTSLTYIWLTGGLHLDGLSDTFDGLGSNRSPERMLEIMKDSRVGVFGVVTLLMTVVIQIAAFERLAGGEVWLVFAPLLGRYGAVFGNTISSYARTQGMGKYFVEFCTWKELLISSLYTLPLVVGLGGSGGVLAIVLVLGFTYFFTRHVQRKLGGITGDVIGAVIELNQLLVLLWAVILVG